MKQLVKRENLQGALTLAQDLKFPHSRTRITHRSLATGIKTYDYDLNSEKQHITASVCIKLETANVSLPWYEIMTPCDTSSRKV